MFTHHPPHLGAWLPVIIIVGVLIAVFEVWMIVNAALNEKISKKAKIWWIVGMLIIHPFVAIVYFFTDRRKR